MKEDINGAILTLADNMRKQDSTTMLKMFGDMGLDGQRAIGVLTNLADKIDDVRHHQETANGAYEKGISVIEEYDVMNDTVEARLEKVKKSFKEMTVELGSRLLPVVRYNISGAGLLAKGLNVLTGFVAKNWKSIVTLTSGIAAYTVAVNFATIKEAAHNALLIVRNGLHKIEAGLLAAKTAALSAWGIIVDLVTGKVTLATAAQQLWNKVILSNPYVAVSAAVMTLVGSILLLINAESKEAKAQEAVNNIRKSAKEKVQEEIDTINTLVDAANNERLSLEERQRAIDKLNNKIPDYNAKLDVTKGKYIANKKALDNYISSLIRMYEVIGAKEKLQEIGRQKVELQLQLEEQRQALKDARERAGSTSGQFQTTSGAMAPGSYHSSIQNSGEISSIEHNIDRINKKAAVLESTSEKIKNIWGTDIQRSAVAPEEPEVDPHKVSPSSSTYGGSGSGSGKTGKAGKTETAAQRKEREERERREAMKKELDDQKTLTDSLLAMNTVQYHKGEITYRKYVEEQHRIIKEGLEGQSAIYKKYGDTHHQLQAKIAEEEFKSQEDQSKFKLADLERQYQMERIAIQSQAQDRSSYLYQNELAVEDLLFQAEMDYLARKKELTRKGSEERATIEVEMTQKEADRQLRMRQYWNEQEQSIREQFLTQDKETQKRILLDGLEEVHRRGLLSEEEYQRARLAIVAQYSRNEVDLRNEAFDRKVGDAVASAKSNATGGYDKSQKLSMGNNPLVGEVNVFLSTLEQLQEMRDQDLLSHEEYEAAKAQITSDFLSGMVSKAQVAFDQVNSLISAASSFYSAQSQYEQAMATKRYDAEIEAAGRNEKKRKKLEEKKQKELAKIKSKYNKKAMKIEVAQAIASTALAAINSYASAAKVNWILGAVAAAMATAAGMVQIATIKKQHAAEEAGYYEGGFTGGRRYRREAGVVHEGEFVANHDAVGNRNLLPFFDLIDRAQRDNRVGSLRAEDVTNVMGGPASAAVVAPVVNVETSNEQMSATLDRLAETVARLERQLDDGIEAYSVIDGPNGSYAKTREYERLIQ